MMKLERIVIKVGSNVLTRPDGTLDVTRISAIVDQIAVLHHRGIEITLVSSGAVASGRSEMRHSVTRALDPVSQRQLYSAVGQAKLINRYYEFFREHGIECGQILTTKENFATRRHYLNQKHCIEVMLQNRVIPIVNENDTVSVTELMFTDNDELSGLIASMMNADALFLLSNIDGIYDGNPADPGSRVIADISADTDVSRFIQDGKSTFGRGGMLTKNRIARKVAGEGISVIVANGKRENILIDLADNLDTIPHTLFHPAQEVTSSVKKWIAHSEGFAKGEIHISRPAAEALLSGRGASLLPIGVTDVKGEFEKGDIVKVIGEDGTLLALGRTSSDSAEVMESKGSRGGRHVIHADYLYIE